jgi:hypothetical protein
VRGAAAGVGHQVLLLQVDPLLDRFHANPRVAGMRPGRCGDGECVHYRTVPTYGGRLARKEADAGRGATFSRTSHRANSRGRAARRRRSRGCLRRDSVTQESAWDTPSKATALGRCPGVRWRSPRRAGAEAATRKEAELSVRSRIGRRSEQLAAEERSRRLARLVGPPLIAISASEAVNLDVVREQYRFDSYLDGSVVFVAGLSLVHGHNRWSSGWPVVLTLTGWAAMLGGLVRMFAPRAETGQAGPSSYAGIAVPFGVGVFLTVKGYARGSHGA